MNQWQPQQHDPRYQPPRGQVQPWQGQWPPPDYRPQQPLNRLQQPPPHPGPQAYWPQPPASPVSPALIIILSFIVPGLGSIVGRSYVHGSIILAAFLLSALSLLIGIGLLLVPITWIWGMIAACVLASRR